MTTDNKTFYTRLGVTVAAVLLVLVVAKVLFFSGSRTTSQAPGPTGPPATTADVVSWQDAADYYGKHCAVEGTIVSTHNSGNTCFLNFHPNWKKYFTAVIFANCFERFPRNPEDFYRGKTVRVTGIVKEYEGKPEIILNSPKQIEVIK